MTLILKKTNPDNLGELRSLSCTPLLSNLLESFLLNELKKHVKLSPTLYSGIKGSGVDHFLINTWHDILSHLEDPRAAATLVSIDFEKAFNRMNHLHCITALLAKGVIDHLVGMVQTFLYQRKMRVKVQGHMLEPRNVPGGSPQGSILANFLFCVTAEPYSTRRKTLEMTSKPTEANIKWDWNFLRTTH